MNISKDHKKIIAILEHKDNNDKHMDVIINCLFLFKRRWYKLAKSTEDILKYTKYCLEQDTKFENLKTKIYGDHKAEF
jgi:hypothetical protein